MEINYDIPDNTQEKTGDNPTIKAVEELAKLGGDTIPQTSPSTAERCVAYTFTIAGQPLLIDISVDGQGMIMDNEDTIKYLLGLKQQQELWLNSRQINA